MMVTDKEWVKAIIEYEQGLKLIKILKSEIRILNKLKRKCDEHGDGQGSHYYSERSSKLSDMLARSKIK